MSVYTRDDLPEIEEGDTLQMKSDTEEYNATVESVRDMGASDAFTVTIDGTPRKMFADSKSVELLLNEYVFIREVTVVN